MGLNEIRGNREGGKGIAPKRLFAEKKAKRGIGKGKRIKRGI